MHAHIRMINKTDGLTIYCSNDVTKKKKKIDQVMQFKIKANQ